MLQDLFASMLGFTGDIIIDTGLTFRVRDGISLHRESERYSINIIAPLGWHYVHLNKLFEKYRSNWSLHRDEGCELYKTAVVSAIDDILHEYVEDVSYMEQYFSSDGSAPLSVIIQHFQKYLLVFPSLLQAVTEMEARNIRGCHLLEYFNNRLSLCGLPLLIDVYKRIIFRLRIILFKQCFCWMLYGELDDPGKEFFIVARFSSTTSGIAAKQTKYLASQNLTMHNSDLSFDWSTSYFIQLDKIPDTEVTPRIASKIMFAGKAKRLLQLSNDNIDHIFERNGVTSNDAYHYFSKGVVDHVKNSALVGDHEIIFPLDAAKGVSFMSNSNIDMQHQLGMTENNLSVLLESQFSISSGYSAVEVNRFSAELKKVVQGGVDSTEQFGRVVEEVSDVISVRLWQLLKQKQGFLQFLFVMRNTYLLGKGELFQLVLDGVLLLTKLHPQQQRDMGLSNGGSGFGSSAAEMDALLNFTVLRNAGKLIGIDDDSLEELLRLRVCSADVQIKDFANVLARDILLTGSAVFSAFGSITTNGAVAPRNPTMILSMTDSQNIVSINHSFERVWSKFLMKRIDFPHPALSSAPSSSDRNISRNEINSVLYSVGSLYFTDQKYVAKGFVASSCFSCDWNSVFNWQQSTSAMSLASSEVLAMFSKAESSSLCLGSLSFIMQAGDVSAAAAVTGARRSSNHAWSSSSADGGDGAAANSAAMSDGSNSSEKKYVVGSAHHPPATAIAGSLAIGVSFHAVVEKGIVRYYAKVFIGRQQGVSMGHGNTRNSMAADDGVGALASGDSEDPAATVSQYQFLAECMVPLLPGTADPSHLDQGTSPNFENSLLKPVSCFGLLTIEIEYYREFVSTHTTAASSSLHGSAAAKSGGSVASAAMTSSSANNTTAVVYKLRARLINADKSQYLEPATWHVEIPLDITSYVKSQCGNSFIGWAATGVVFQSYAAHSHFAKSHHQSSALGQFETSTLLSSTSLNMSNEHRQDTKSAIILPSTCFSVDLFSVSVACKGTIVAYPTASPFTNSRYPDTGVRLNNAVKQFRMWLDVTLQLKFPSVLRIIFDNEAVLNYERIFSFIFKIRLVVHALEKLWSARSAVFASDRMICHIRHGMHFFISNLLYYLQVDVVDSEFGELIRIVSQATDLQVVLRAHKTFVANLFRLSLIDNLSIQEAFDRIIHVCLRFIAVLHIMLDNSEGKYSNHDNVNAASTTKHHSSNGSSFTVLPSFSPTALLPLFVPPEEMQAICKEFFSQVTYLFHLMRSVDCKGFMFRLDFNRFLSSSSVAVTLLPTTGNK